MTAKKKYCYEYPRPSVTVDCVVFGYAEGEGLQLLLIRRGGEPFLGAWALPGGFVDMEEDLDDAALRELREETGFEPTQLEPLGAYGKPGRDPRGRVITMAYLGLVRRPVEPVRGGSDASEAAWFPAEALPDLAFDHAQIIQDARERLRVKVRREPAGLDLLPEAFTLSQLQAVYEAVLGTGLDKRNFRKKILKFGVLRVLKGQQLTGHQRPAQLYAFDHDLYVQLAQKGIDFEV